MTYNDQQHTKGSKIAYDGKLIDAKDAVARYERDKAIKLKYELGQAEENQLTFEDIKHRLSGHDGSDPL